MDNEKETIAALKLRIDQMQADIDIHTKVIDDLQKLVMAMSDRFTQSILSTGDSLSALSQRFVDFQQTSIKETDANTDQVVNLYHMIADVFDRLLPVFYKSFPEVRDTEKQIEAILKQRPAR